MSALVEIKGLSKFFKTKNGMLHAVDGVNMSFEKGDVYKRQPHRG